MGELEKYVKRKTTRQNIQKIILKTIAAVGFLGIAVLAPNALKMLKMFDAGRQRSKDPKYSINLTISKLLNAKLIYFENSSKGKLVRLTEKGEQKLRMAENYNFKIEKPSKWDGKWRILIFDIKINRNNTRDKLRETLKAIGFAQLQKSVWVFPYDCEDLIVLLKADFKIGKDVLYMIVDRIENDGEIRKFFKI